MNKDIVMNTTEKFIKILSKPETLENKDLVKIILTKGIDPLDFAIANCAIMYSESLPLIVKEAINQNPDIEIIKLLLEVGVDPNSRKTEDNWNTAALHYAARHNNLELAQLLISSGAEVDVRDKNDNTPLHYVDKTDSIEVVEFLIQSGADVNAKAIKGSTPLHYAAWNNHLAVAKLLISSGAEVNAKNDDGRTPLHRAALRNSLELAQLLISSGADLYAIDNNGERPIDIALSRIINGESSIKNISKMIEILL